LPIVVDSLLEAGADTEVGGVCREGEVNSNDGVCQERGGGETLLQSVNACANSGVQLIVALLFVFGVRTA
jgi:hypothetical protein